MRRLVIAALLCIGFGTTGAGAASFECHKARSATERAVCADAGLSALDDAVAAAFDAAMTTVSAVFPSPDPDEEAASALADDQRAWLKLRDRCGVKPACLQRQYQRRLAVLRFQPDPEAPAPIDRFLGRFDDGVRGHAAILRLTDGRALINLDNASDGFSWTCGFAGIATLAGRDRLVARVDFDGTQLTGSYTVLLTAAGIRLATSPERTTADEGNCGSNGRMTYEEMKRQ